MACRARNHLEGIPNGAARANYVRLASARSLPNTKAMATPDNVEDVTVQPAEIKLPEALVTAVGDFAWSLAYHHHPGFENNEGGYGTLTWDLRNDSITLDHADRYVECSHSYVEGL